MNQKKGRSEKGLWRLLAFVLTFALMINMMPPKLLIVKAEGSTLVTDGGKITWDFRDESSPVYTSGVDGSLSVQGTFTYDESKSQHGATIGNDTVFSIAVPAGQTTLTFGVCAYGSSTAVISAGETVLQEAFPLGGAAQDGQEAVVQYTSETDSMITVTVTGNGFIHSISAETTTPPQVASVQGTVADESGSAGGADGQTLIFADENGQTTETEIAEGSFAVSLPVGHTYTVSFANSDVYEITGGNTIDLTGTENGADGRTSGNGQREKVLRLPAKVGKENSRRGGGQAGGTASGATVLRTVAGASEPGRQLLSRQPQGAEEAVPGEGVPPDQERRHSGGGTAPAWRGHL